MYKSAVSTFLSVPHTQKFEGEIIIKFARFSFVLIQIV